MNTVRVGRTVSQRRITGTKQKYPVFTSHSNSAKSFLEKVRFTLLRNPTRASWFAPFRWKLKPNNDSWSWVPSELRQLRLWVSFSYPKRADGCGSDNRKEADTAALPALTVFTANSGPVSTEGPGQAPATQIRRLTRPSVLRHQYRTRPARGQAKA